MRRPVAIGLVILALLLSGVVIAHACGWRYHPGWGITPPSRFRE